MEEKVLVQLILLNLRPSEKVQHIYNIDTYISVPIEIFQEEVASSLTEMEIQLTKKLKRIVVRGKRGRRVPILFTPVLQKTVEVANILNTKI